MRLVSNPPWQREMGLLIVAFRNVSLDRDASDAYYYFEVKDGEVSKRTNLWLSKGMILAKWVSHKYPEYKLYLDDEEVKDEQ